MYSVNCNRGTAISGYPRRNIVDEDVIGKFDIF